MAGFRPAVFGQRPKSPQGKGLQSSYDLAAVMHSRAGCNHLRKAIAGSVAPIIHATFPLAKAADAHRLMESSAHIGKIVLTTE